LLQPHPHSTCAIVFRVHLQPSVAKIQYITSFQRIFATNIRSNP
jgi:hypothetical protein